MSTADRHLPVLVLLALLGASAPLAADTQTSLGARSGEGSTQFTSLAQAPEANLFTGAMTTRVSIDIPPGRKNMTPQLALEYSSSGGPSPFGYGWSLPIGSIERTTKWGVPHCDSPHFEEFVLMLPGGVTAELIEDSPNSNTYRPKIEQAYVRATLDVNTNTWTVRDRAGIKYTFGAGFFAKIGTLDYPPLEQSHPDGSCDFTATWALTDMEDQNGNEVEVEWHPDTNTKRFLTPWRIHYGGNGSALAHFHHIDFVYTSTNRPSVVSYKSGFRQELSSRLWRVEVRTDLPPASGGLVRTYVIDDFATEQASNTLAGVTVEDQPTQYFFYSDWVSPAGHQPETTPAQVTVPSSFPYLRDWNASGEVHKTTLDMNGDGLLDLVWGEGFPWDVYFGYVDKNPQTGEVTWGIESGVTDWSGPSLTHEQIRNVYQNTDPCQSPIECTAIDTFDITGDGLPDYVVATNSSCEEVGYPCNWQVYEGRHEATGGWGFASSFTPWPAPGIMIRKSFEGDTYRDVIDMNGDGLVDYVWSEEDWEHWDVYLNTGNGFADDPLPHWPSPVDYLAKGANTANTVLTDFNGDGLPDIVTLNIEDPDRPCSGTVVEGGTTKISKCVWVYLNTGQGFSETAEITRLPTFTPGLRSSDTGEDGDITVDMLDINGDGLPDWIRGYGEALEDQWEVVLNVGGKFEALDFAPLQDFPAIFHSHAPRIWAGGSGPLRRSPGTETEIDFIDLNGDGFLDHVDTGESNTWTVKLSRLATKPILMAGMENGLGGTSTIIYEPSSHFDNTGGDDVPDLPFKTWLVVGTRLNDGLCDPDEGDNVFDPEENDCIGEGHELISRFEYLDGRYSYEVDGSGNPIDRDFRGFREVTRSDIFGNETVTVFGQETITKGRVIWIAYYAGAGQSLVRFEANGWKHEPVGAGRTKIWLEANVRSLWDGGTVPLVALSYNGAPDAFGNVTHTWTTGTNIPHAVHVETTFATAAAGSDYYAPLDRPRTTKTWHDLDDDGQLDSPGELLEEKRFSYDGNSDATVSTGNVTKIETRLVNAGEDRWLQTQTYYDVYGNVFLVVDAKGHGTGTLYNNDGAGAHLFPTLEVNALSHQSVTRYDYGLGKPVIRWGPNGPGTIVFYQYDRAGRIRKEIAPGDTAAAPTVEYTYNFTTSPPSAEVARKQSGYAPLKVTAYFDALGRRRYTVTPRVVNGSSVNVRAESVVFDAGGNVIERFHPHVDGGPANNGSTRFDYHLNGVPSRIDPLGRVFKTTHSDGTTRFSLYLGPTTINLDEAGQRTDMVVDAQQREIKRVAYAGATAYASAETLYDGLGRAFLFYQNRTQANIPMKIMWHDTLGRKYLTYDRDSGFWRYYYDDVGNLIAQDDPKAGQHLQIAYDELNRPLRRCDFPGNYTTPLITGTGPCSGTVNVRYEYDDDNENLNVPNPVGRVVRITDGAGQTRTLGFDARGREIGVARRLEVPGVVAAGEAVFEYEHNDTDQVTAVTYPGGEVVTTTYDAAGQPTTVCNDDGYIYVDSANYDIFGRLTHLEKGNGATDQALYVNSRHRLSELVSTPTGTGGIARVAQSYTYTARGQIDHVVDNSLSTGELRTSANYTYDALGRLTSYVNPNVSALNQIYQYDAWGRILKKGDLDFGYPSPFGANPHQATAIDGFPFTQYDANGNRGTSYNGGAIDQDYIYDAEDRLQSVVAADGLSFFYDDQGQQRIKVVDDDIGANEVTRYYSSLIEVTASGQAIKSYFLGGQRVASRVETNAGWQFATLNAPGPVQVAAEWAGRPVVVVALTPAARTAAGVGATLLLATLLLLPLQRRRAALGMRLRHGDVLVLVLLFGTGTLPWPLLVQPAAACVGSGCPTPTPNPPAPQDIRYFHYDHLGSPLMITDGDGAVVEQIRYEPYGAVRGRYGPSGVPQPLPPPNPNEVRYEFTGYESELNTGLQYANARFYDPELGMFLTQDPAGEFANPYTYTGWDPVNRVDPSGASVVLLGLILGFIIGFAVAAIQAGINGASFGEALAAGLLAGTIGGVTGSLLGPLGSGLVKAGYGAAFYGAMAAASTFGTVQSFQQGQVFAGVIGAIGSLLAFAAFAYYTKGALAGAQPSVTNSQGSVGGGGGGAQSRGLAQAEIDEFGPLFHGRDVPGDFWSNVQLDNSAGAGGRGYTWRWPWSNRVSIHMGGEYSGSPIVGQSEAAATLGHELAHALDFRQSWFGTALGALKDQTLYSSGVNVYNPSLNSAGSLSGFSVEGRATLYEWSYRTYYGIPGGAGSNYPATSAAQQRLYNLLYP